jgi:hypothetical protein
MFTNFIVAANTHATLDEMSDASFSMQSVSYQEMQAIGSSENFFYYYPSVYSLEFYWSDFRTKILLPFSHIHTTCYMSRQYHFFKGPNNIWSRVKLNQIAFN